MDGGWRCSVVSGWLAVVVVGDGWFVDVGGGGWFVEVGGGWKWVVLW